MHIDTPLSRPGAVGGPTSGYLKGVPSNLVHGTGVRDYIHVMDLAAGHLSALRLLDGPKCFAVNLGTGEGSSVLEVVRAFEAVSERNIPYEVKPRRPGDIGACYARHRLCVEVDELAGDQVARNHVRRSRTVMPDALRRATAAANRSTDSNVKTICLGHQKTRIRSRPLSAARCDHRTEPIASA
jgi:nucleoside-diphosphate-sugar epimerase